MYNIQEMLLGDISSDLKYKKTSSIDHSNRNDFSCQNHPKNECKVPIIKYAKEIPFKDQSIA